MNVFVTGGSGTLGRVLVPRLVAENHQVTVASRKPAEPSGARAASIDLSTGRGLDALAGIDTVIHLATDPFDASTDLDGTTRLLDAAAHHGVGHLVLMSIVGIDDHPWPYYRTKLAQEALVSDGPVPWTILRATQFHDLIPRFIREMPAVGVVPVPIGLRIQPVDTDVVADRLLELVDAGPSGRVDDLGGPEVIAARTMVSDTLRALGLRRAIVPIPLFGAMGTAFRDGRMLSEHRATGRRWSDWVSDPRSLVGG